MSEAVSTGTDSTNPDSMDSVSASTVALHETTTVALGAPEPKPTATTPGLVEASLDIWTSGAISTGIWEASPGSFTATREGYAEICTFLSGSVTVQGDGEEPIEYGPGDVLITPPGWSGVWHVHETVRKHYTIVTD